jgi:mannose-1-phosphate guanylyltransferase
MKHRTSIEFPLELWKRLNAAVPNRKKAQFIIDAVREKLSKQQLKVLILCGGEGTRLRPLTLTTPKPMLPLGYKPILEYLIDFFKQNGFYNFVLAIGYLGEHIIKYFGDGSRFGVNIEYSTEDRPLGTGGALKNSEKFFNSTLIMVNGDVLFKGLQLKEVLQFHKQSGGLATIVLWYAKDARRFGLVEIAEGGLIKRFIEKPKRLTAGWINAGLYILEPAIFKLLKKNQFISLESKIFPRLAAQSELYGYRFNGYWADIGVPKDYERVTRDILFNP